MPLTEEEKQKIEEEERVRAEARAKYIKQETKKKGSPFALGCLILILIPVFVIVINSYSNVKQAKEQLALNKATSTEAVQEQPAEDAKKELSDLMATAQKAKLIDSYEFSNSANIVYAGSAWYGQTVAFKKDFIAKIAMLKEKMTGYRHFEVKDAYSNEKVAEVTAFSGSLEVYK